MALLSDRYTYESRIGHGAYGSVIKAKDSTVHFSCHWEKHLNNIFIIEYKKGNIIPVIFGT
jgi:hypothetical protein